MDLIKVLFIFDQMGEYHLDHVGARRVVLVVVGDLACPVEQSFPFFGQAGSVSWHVFRDHPLKG